MADSPTTAQRSPFSLAGRHALIAGGASDLGRALAVALAGAGARVSLTTARETAHEEMLVNSILNECWAMGRDGVVRRVDLSDAAAVATAVASIETQAGPIDVLVNAALEVLAGPLLDATEDQWRAAHNRGASIAFHTMQAVGASMVARGHGRIINLVATLADRRVARGAAQFDTLGAMYGATQGAVLALTRSARLEWAQAGVVVSALPVGFVDSVTVPPAGTPERAALDPYLPGGRAGAAPDVTSALLYLASDVAMPPVARIGSTSGTRRA